MSWTTPADLRSQVEKLWERGDLLAELVHALIPALVKEPADESAKAGTLFPKRLVLKGPGSSELASQYAAVRQWIASLEKSTPCRIVTRRIQHRVLGQNDVPESAWIDSLDNALALIGKQGEATTLVAMVNLTSARQPALIAWMARRPFRALALADEWSRLLDVVTWMQSHPLPGIYLRQVDIAGVHSKFIELHCAVLGELFELALPATSILAGPRGPAQFVERFGFRTKPLRVRMRLLDPRLGVLPGLTLPDVTLDAASFAALDLPLKTIFITENETNFLAFPPFPAAAVIFGSGYGWSALAQAAWLLGCTIHYWGDIDTHGFAILNQLRHHFPHVESLLMDRATLMAHAPFWSPEHSQVRHDLDRLNAAERALFDDLRDNRIAAQLRLEQELIVFSHLESRLRSLSGESQRHIPTDSSATVWQPKDC